MNAILIAGILSFFLKGTFLLGVVAAVVVIALVWFVVGLIRAARGGPQS